MLFVLLCSRRLSAHSVFLVVAGCLGPSSCAPLFCIVGPRSWVGFPSWSVPLLRIFVIKNLCNTFLIVNPFNVGSSGACFNS